MKFVVWIHPSVEKKIKKLPKAHQEKLRTFLDALGEEPVPPGFDVVKLKKVKNTYRLRIGGYRLTYTVFWKEKRIAVTKLEPRESAYKKR